MTRFKLKQIGLALCLMASLLFGSASACTCSHHQEKAEAPEDSCHGTHHESAAESESAVTLDTVDVDCICVADSPSPSVLSKADGKELRPDEAVSGAAQVVFDLESAPVEQARLTTPVFDRDLSYSNVLKSLLRSRAPPRL